MTDLAEMPVILDCDGVTVRRLADDDGEWWAVTRTAEATPEAIARALEEAPNPLGWRMTFPVTGSFTCEFYYPSQG